MSERKPCPALHDGDCECVNCGARFNIDRELTEEELVGMRQAVRKDERDSPARIAAFHISFIEGILERYGR